MTSEKKELLVLDRNVLLEMVGGDEATANILFKNFYEESFFQFLEILGIAWEEKDIGKMESASHKAKGALG